MFAAAASKHGCLLLAHNWDSRLRLALIHNMWAYFLFYFANPLNIYAIMRVSAPKTRLLPKVFSIVHKAPFSFGFSLLLESEEHWQCFT